MQRPWRCILGRSGVQSRSVGASKRKFRFYVPVEVIQTPSDATKGASSMVNQELDYEIPSRPVVCAWVSLALLMTVIGIWSYPLTAMIVFSCVIVIWMNLYSTILHYALDAEEFRKLPVVGGAIITFQSHHFPRW